MSKAELAELYGISSGTLANLLNVTFYEKLKAVGYSKHQKILSPKVVRKFWELYDKPLNPNEQYV